jgi:hypothetical protein
MTKMGEMVRGAYNWLTLADYDKVKEEAVNNIVSRYARGNINFQNGSVLDEDEVRLLSKEGDRALASLNKRSPII